MDLRLVVAVVAVAMLAAALITARLARRRDRRRRERRARRAVAGEHESQALLEAAGYRVLDRQVRGELTLWIDGAPIAFEVRADFVVERGGQRFVAEVKTGELAPRIDYAPTRRQLIEYLLAYQVSGVILVDADTGTLTDVSIYDGREWPSATG